MRVLPHPGVEMHALKQARMARGWSQSRAIAELQRHAQQQALRLPAFSSMKTELSRWENGHRTPDAFYRGLLELAYGMSSIDLGIAEAPSSSVIGLVSGASWELAASTAEDLWMEDMDRRSLLKSSAFAVSAFAAPTLQALVSPDVGSPTRTGAARGVTAGDVAAISELTSGFARLDNQYGGGQARDIAARCLATDVAPLLRSGAFSGRLGTDLFRASAELCQLVGWMTYDIGAYGLGQRYLIQALGLARAASDQPLVGEILAAMSHQAAYQGEAQAAVDLARAAGQMARRYGVQALSAEAAVMEAHGHAIAGDGAQCAAALDRAERELDRADRAADPHWIGYFDDAYLSAKFGHCFLALADTTNAIRFAERSLDMDPHYARGRAFNLALLANSHALAGDVTAACATGLQAAKAVTDLRSSRATGYLRRLRADLEQAASSEDVQRLDRVLQPLISAA